MKRKIHNLINRLFPMTRMVHFRTPDGTCANAMGVSNNILFFGLLKKPIIIEDVSKAKIPIKNLKETRYKGNWVQLAFYSPESIDRLIEKLNEIKSNLELLEISEILKNGGEMVWTKLDEPKMPEGMSVEHYKLTFEYPLSKK